MTLSLLDISLSISCHLFSKPFSWLLPSCLLISRCCRILEEPWLTGGHLTKPDFIISWLQQHSSLKDIPSPAAPHTAPSLHSWDHAARWNNILGQDLCDCQGKVPELHCRSASCCSSSLLHPAETGIQGKTFPTPAKRGACTPAAHGCLHIPWCRHYG